MFVYLVLFVNIYIYISLNWGFFFFFGREKERKKRKLFYHSLTLTGLLGLKINRWNQSEFKGVDLLIFYPCSRTDLQECHALDRFEIEMIPVNSIHHVHFQLSKRFVLFCFFIFLFVC